MVVMMLAVQTTTRAEEARGPMLPPGLTQTVDALLKNIRARDRDAAFALLSAGAQEKLGSTPKAFMNTVRLLHHALYDHEGYHFVAPPAQLASTSPTPVEMMVRIQLVDYDQHETLLIIRMRQDEGQKWQIHGLTTLQDDQGRDA